MNPLTDREQAVLDWLAEGLSDIEIGEQMHLSRWTIKTYTSRIYDKLGARSRTHAVALAYHRGLLVPMVTA